MLGVKIIGRQLLRPAESVEGLGDADTVIREGAGCILLQATALEGDGIEGIVVIGVFNRRPGPGGKVPYLFGALQVALGVVGVDGSGEDVARGRT